jgi:hypothetical protein
MGVKFHPWVPAGREATMNKFRVGTQERSGPMDRKPWEGEAETMGSPWEQLCPQGQRSR